MEAGQDGMEARQGTGKKRDRVDRLRDYNIAHAGVKIDCNKYMPILAKITSPTACIK